MNIQSSLVQDHLYIDWQGQGTPLLLLHGWGMNGAVWQTIVPDLLALGFRVGSVDLPGFGDSPAQTPATLTCWAECIERVILRLNQPVHLLGWSLGGLLAMKLGLMIPDRLATLVSIASSPCFQAQAHWPGIKPQVLQSFAAQLQQDLPKTLQGFLTLQTMGSVSARDNVRTLKLALSSRTSPDPHALNDGLTMLKEVDLRRDVAKITAPWLRIYGKLDALVPVRSMALLDQLAPQSQSVLIAGASHAPFISHREQTIELLRQFYQKHVYSDQHE